MSYLKFEVFIPPEDSPKLIEALNDKGLIKDGPYDYVYASTKIQGHFRPLEGAKPHIGEIAKVEELTEDKLEFRIREEDKEEAYNLIVNNHPYEIPVINIIKLEYI